MDHSIYFWGNVYKKIEWNGHCLLIISFSYKSLIDNNFTTVEGTSYWFYIFTILLSRECTTSAIMIKSCENRNLVYKISLKNSLYFKFSTLPFLHSKMLKRICDDSINITVLSWSPGKNKAMNFLFICLCSFWLRIVIKCAK